MKATDRLKAEHTLIERALCVLERELMRIEEGASPDLGLLARLTQFFDEFVDQIHHREEEEVLFPALEEYGIARDHGPIGVLLMEHQQAKSILATLGTGAALELVQDGRGYTYLLRQHIQKEDQVLFALADSCLPPVAQEALWDRFERMEQEQAGLRARAEALVTELERRRNT